jgi:regulator of sigma E protease
MSLPLLLEYAGYGVVFLLMISILVAAHELGHYLFARLFNMGVEEFAIGFGRRRVVTWGHRTYTLPIHPGEDWQRTGTAGQPNGDAATFVATLEGSSPDRQIERIETPEGPMLRETTDFTIRPWPLGGFVRIKGMQPDEDGSETKITGGFYSKPPWQRFLVLLAGPLFSILAGILVLVPVLMIDGKMETNYGPVLGGLVAGKPADKAGLKTGDRIVSIDGAPISRFYDMILKVRESKGKPLTFLVDRNGARSVHEVVPYLEDKATPLMDEQLNPTGAEVQSYKIGALPNTIQKRLPFGAAVGEAVDMPVQAVLGLVKLFQQPQKFKDSVGGPATMVSATASAVDSGFWKVLSLSALLSISVGIMNLLPAPPLDGGQMVMSVAEMLRGGRRLSIRAQAIASGIGLTFVAALILGVFVVDFQRFTGPKEKLEIVKSK